MSGAKTHQNRRSDRVKAIAPVCALAAACALAPGCSGAALPGDFELAQARERTHDPEAALAIYRHSDEQCTRFGSQVYKHDDCALAIVRSAQLLEQLNRWREAYDTWRRVPERTTDARKAARALARAAQIADDELHDEAAADQLAWACMERFPDEVPTDDALAVAVRIGKRRGGAELAARLMQLYPNVAKRDLGDNVLYESAELHRAAGDGPGAIALYDRLTESYPHSGLRDDSIWHAAELLRAAGDAHGALRHLQKILDSRRDALITGSYNSIYLDDAQLLVGRIWLEDLHDSARAADAFRILADDFKESILRDDALVWLARAESTRHAPATERDKLNACGALARLFKKYPDSNMTRAGHELATELACP